MVFFIGAALFGVGWLNGRDLITELMMLVGVAFMAAGLATDRAFVREVATFIRKMFYRGC